MNKTREHNCEHVTGRCRRNPRYIVIGNTSEPAIRSVRVCGRHLAYATHLFKLPVSVYLRADFDHTEVAP